MCICRKRFNVKLQALVFETFILHIIENKVRSNAVYLKTWHIVNWGHHPISDAWNESTCLTTLIRYFLLLFVDDNLKDRLGLTADANFNCNLFRRGQVKSYGFLLFFVKTISSDMVNAFRQQVCWYLKTSWTEMNKTKFVPKIPSFILRGKLVWWLYFITARGFSGLLYYIYVCFGG